jgi:formate transporter
MNQPLPAASPVLDALLPADMARKAEEIGVAKARLSRTATLSLSLLAGAFIALGANFSTVATTGAAGSLPYGVTRLVAGTTFSLGLILVVVGGAELFTGNNLIVMAWASGKISSREVLRNWSLVYAGNFAGAVLMAGLILLTRQHELADGRLGLNALTIAEAKCRLDPVPAVTLGVACNLLVCLAVWLCFSARSVTDRVLAIVPPIAAFVAAGFEHSVANMYFIPLGLGIQRLAGPRFWESIARTPADFPHLTWPRFLLNNLLPVTLGNIIGGALLVGLVYWSIYLRPPRQTALRTSSQSTMATGNTAASSQC